MREENLLGQRLGEYRLEALLGKGGMASVYWGVNVKNRQQAAVKVIEASLRDDADYRNRFAREAQAIARLHHPHIVRLYQHGEEREVIYIAMQFILGADLASVLTGYHSLRHFMPAEDVVRIARQIGMALDYAHLQGVIHRDIKPSNILLDEKGSATLTDFGLVLLTDVGTRGEAFGTPFYISPEQAVSSAGAVPQSDQYSLGVILYELLTGKLPFDAGTAMDTAILHITQPPPSPRKVRPELGKEVEAVLLKALEKKPEDRYPNCAELANALEQALRISKPLPPESGPTLLDFIDRCRPTLPTVPGKQEERLPEPVTRPASTASGARPATGWGWVVLALLVSLATLAALVWLGFLSGG
jgi:serine/threonine-protein kinase